MAGGSTVSSHNGHGTRLVDVAAVKVPRGRPPVGDVTELAESIASDVGLLNPINVTTELRLIAGRRRLEAHRVLGLKQIRATVMDLSDLQAELAEIDENLIRNELTVLERGEYLKRRKEIYESLHPETRRGVAGGKARQGAATEIISFAEDAASAAKVTERTIRHEVQIAESIAPETKKLIRRTPLADNKSELLRLARVEPTKQAATVKAIASGEASTVSQAVRVVERAQKKKDLATRAAAAPTAGSNGHAPWKIITGDSTVEMPKLYAAGKRYRLIFADPPYNQGVDYGDGGRADRMTADEYLRWCGVWMEQCRDLLTDDGSLWVLISAEWADDFGVLLRRAIGLHRRNWVVWFESFGMNSSSGRNFNRCHRHLFHMVRDPNRFVFNADAVNRPSDRLVKYGDKRADPNGKVWDDVWGINPAIPRLVENAAERIPEFPTQLPLALLRPIVGCASDPGDEVLDCFSGSGTTVAACLELGRVGTGIDKSANYVGLSQLRLRAMAAERSAS